MQHPQAPTILTRPQPLLLELSQQQTLNVEWVILLLDHLLLRGQGWHFTLCNSSCNVAGAQWHCYLTNWRSLPRYVLIYVIRESIKNLLKNVLCLSIRQCKYEAKNHACCMRTLYRWTCTMPDSWQTKCLVPQTRPCTTLNTEGLHQIQSICTDPYISLTCCWFSIALRIP